MTKILVTTNNLQLYGIAFFSVTLMILLTGCDYTKHNPEEIALAQAKLVCNHIHRLYKYEGTDNRLAEIRKISFALERENSGDPLVKYFCNYDEGFVPPSEKVTPSEPTPIPVMFLKLKELDVIKPIDRCKILGIKDTTICNCLKDGGTRHECLHPEDKVSKNDSQSN